MKDALVARRVHDQRRVVGEPTDLVGNLSSLRGIAVRGTVLALRVPGNKGYDPIKKKVVRDKMMSGLHRKV